MIFQQYRFIHTTFAELKAEIATFILNQNRCIGAEELKANFPVSDTTLTEMFPQTDRSIIVIISSQRFFCCRMHFVKEHGLYTNADNRWKMLKTWLKEHNKVPGEGYHFVLKRMEELEKEL